MTTTSTDWTILERLLLAQAVNKFGEDDWFQVARTLKQHPLLQGQERPEAFNQKNCSLQYYLMIENLETESRRHKAPNSIATQNMPNVVKLARQLYKQRVEDLKRSIKEDEDQFMKLVSEIDDIKSGAWDNKLTALANEQQRQQELKALPKNIEDTASTSNQQVSPMSIDDQSNLNDDNNNNKNNLKNNTKTSGITINEDNKKEEVVLEKIDKSNISQPIEKEIIKEKVDLPTTSNDMNNQTNQIQTSSSIPSVTENTTMIENNASLPITLEKASPVLQTEESASSNIEINKSKPTTNLQTNEPSSKPTRTDDSSETTFSEHGIKRRSDDTVASQLDSSQVINEVITKKPRIEEHEQSATPTTSNILPDSTENVKTVPVVKIEEINTNENLNETKETISKDNKIKSETAESNIPLYAISSPPASVSSSLSSTLSDIESPIKSTKSDIKNEPSSSSSHIKMETISNQPDSVENTSMNVKSENVIQDADGNESINESNPPTPTTTNEKRRPGAATSKDDQRQKSWQKNVNLLWREIANHKNGAMFMNPIKEAQAPLYYDVVKYPMDLKTIKNRIRDGIIRTTAEFERDVVLMLTNSLMYNKEGTEIYQMALEMLEDVTEQIKIFKTADGNSTANTRSTSLLKDKRKNLAE